MHRYAEVLILTTLTQDDFMEVLKSHLYQISLVFVAEVFADWIKHAFITKVRSPHWRFCAA